jgi:tetratricopeptide (TPR) repeat protein
MLYEITEGEDESRSRRLTPRAEWPEGIPVTVDNRARLHTAWFWEPVPLPEKRPGPAVFVVHAGEPYSRLPGALELDLREAHPDLTAAYAIFRRYLFDYRVDLETPLWLLIDGESRVRKVYAETPDAATAHADLSSVNRPLPEKRGVPFEGVFTGLPQRDYYKFGGALLQAGYPEQALPYLEEMLRRTPDNPKALIAVGRIHLEAKRLPEARASLQRALTLNPQLPNGWNELGGVESDAGHLSEALRCYEKALALAPDLTYALINAAQTNDKLGNAAEAERLYRRVLAIDPRHGDAANGLGLVLAKQGQTSEARKLFELAISVRRDDSSAINNLGVLFMKIGQTNDAIAAFQYGIEVAPDDEMLYLNLARVWVGMGDREKAGEVMRKLLARKPDSVVAQRALKQLEAQ